MLNIPTPTKLAGAFTQRTRLDGSEFLLRFAHNARSGSWTLDVSTFGTPPVPLITGRKVFIGDNLLGRCLDESRPRGTLLALSADGSRKAPGLNELGTRVRLVYLSEGETFGV